MTQPELLTAARDDHAPGSPEGTFSSFLDVFFDLTFGSPSGPITFQSDLVLTNSGAFWDANPTPSEFLLLGLKGDVTANFHTNTIQNADIVDMDFFPVGTFSESPPNRADVHEVGDPQTPEPGTMVIIGGTLLALSRMRRRVVQRKFILARDGS